MTPHRRALNQITAAAVTSQQSCKQNFRIGQFDTVHTARQVIRYTQDTRSI